MSDVIRDLRIVRSFLTRQGYTTSAQVVRDAIAEIERLRAAQQA